jgi:transposase InsO family protein
MGLKTAGSYFQQQISHVVLQGLIFQICEVYIDDVIIHGETMEEFLENLAKVFKRFRQYRIYLNPDKCVLGVNEIEYVGHVVNEHGISMSREKINKVLKFPIPEKLKELRSFLGLVNYFRDHIAQYATVVGPLYTRLHELTKSRQLKWTEEAHNAFIAIQKAIDECPTLFFVDDTSPITLQTDASDYGIGGYLFQTTIDGKQKPIRFVSKAFTRPQLAWSTFAKEAYAIIYCIKKLDYLLRDSKFEIQTDHRNLLFLKESSDAKVVRWNMALADYNFTTQYIVGKSNVVADAMSRFLPNPKEGLTKDIAAATCELQRTNLMAILHNIDLPDDKYALIKDFHNSHVGHFGFEHTMRKLLEYGHKWKYMRSHVKKFLRECPMCQKMNPIVHAVSAIRFTTAAYEPFTRISLDTIGPLPESKEGFKFILVVIDCFTRVIELYPCKSTEADEAAHHLVDFLSRYGIPDQLLSDRGTQFINSIFETLVLTMGSEHLQSLANSKQETAIVERVNKEVLRFLIPLVYLSKNLEAWVDNIPLVRRIYLTHPHDSTGVAPATLLYGPIVQLERGIFPDARLPEEQPNRGVPPRGMDAAWITQMYDTQRALLEVAQKHQRELDSENLAERTQRSEPITEFPIGSYVLALYKDQHSRGKGRPKHKLLTVKQGPFRVI